LASQQGAENELTEGIGQLFAAEYRRFNGVMLWSELVTDEFTFAGSAFFGSSQGPDARVVYGGSSGFYEIYPDNGWASLLQARQSMLLALPNLVKYEPASGRSHIGEAYALIGYTEILLAEQFCAGTPLDAILPGGGYEYGTPLTTDSMLGVAEVDLDSAVAEANGDPSISGLASVGLARALLDRGQYAAAEAAVADVPTNFVFNGTLQPSTSASPGTVNVYAGGVSTPFDAIFNTSDNEGENGLNFISAHDPRLTFDTTHKTLNGFYRGAVPATWYLPEKFATDLSDIPLASGIEARLIAAEAELEAGNATTWAADLSALRTDSADTHVHFDGTQVPIQTDSTTGASAAAQVDFQFREKAFWLFGTGTRMGDLRRLIRQYGRDPETVYPTGPYMGGTIPTLPAFGTDVALTVPTPAGLASGQISVTNPNYKGCLTSTATP
jgi:hypothetical protein